MIAASLILIEVFLKPIFVQLFKLAYIALAHTSTYWLIYKVTSLITLQLCNFITLQLYLQVILQVLPTPYQWLNNIKGADMLSIRRQIFTGGNAWFFFGSSITKKCIHSYANTSVIKHPYKAARSLNSIYALLSCCFGYIKIKLWM